MVQSLMVETKIGIFSASVGQDSSKISIQNPGTLLETPQNVMKSCGSTNSATAPLSKRSGGVRLWSPEALGGLSRLPVEGINSLGSFVKKFQKLKKEDSGGHGTRKLLNSVNGIFAVDVSKAVFLGGVAFKHTKYQKKTESSVKWTFIEPAIFSC